HLVNTEHINAEFVQCDLAIICLQYLSLRCFAAEDYTEAERREHIPQGYFSFQDYAASQWYRHIASVITSCKGVFLPPPPPSSIIHHQHHYLVSDPAIASEQRQRDYYINEFTSALARFTSAYDKDLQSSSVPHPELPLDDLAAYSSLPFYPSLHRLWNHICTHQKSSVEDRNKVGIARLEDAIKLHRAAIETDFRPSSRTIGSDTMEQYYGPNLFKCQRLLCKFFHQGFDAKKDRDTHHSRHDRPYRCLLETCGFAPVGFSSNKDRERHVRNYHPELSDAPSAFLQMSRRVETAKFKCKMCPKTFTRNINLKGHERSHFDTKLLAALMPTLSLRFDSSRSRSGKPKLWLESPFKNSDTLIIFAGRRIAEANILEASATYDCRWQRRRGDETTNDCYAVVEYRQADHRGDQQVARPIQEIVEPPTADNLRRSTEPRCKIRPESNNYTRALGLSRGET
ncbi:zinc finger protein, partial [Colletotrichum incanum]